MKITITKVTQMFPRAAFIQWDVTPNPGVTGVFAFDVYRSGSPNGPWTQIGARLVDTVFAYDDLSLATDGTNTQSLVRDLFYRVVVFSPDNQTMESPIVDINGYRVSDTKEQVPFGIGLKTRQVLLRRKILRDESISFQALNGVHVDVRKRKHFGVRCTVCFDKLTKTVTKSKCTSCYGTGWEGGFYPPIRTYARFGASPTDTALTSEGKTDTNQNRITLLNYPGVDEGDLICEQSPNHIWIVKQVNPTELRRFSVHQRVVASELPHSAPEHLLIGAS